MIYIFNKIKNIIFDRNKSEEEYKTVIRVLERCRHRNYSYVSYEEVKKVGDKRAYDYNDLNKLADSYWSLYNQNVELEREIRTLKENAANTSLVIDTILDTVEKRYDQSKKGDEIETHNKTIRRIPFSRT